MSNLLLEIYEIIDDMSVNMISAYHHNSVEEITGMYKTRFKKLLDKYETGGLGINVEKKIKILRSENQDLTISIFGIKEELAMVWNRFGTVSRILQEYTDKKISELNGPVIK